jgi:hypothetical protein
VIFSASALSEEIEVETFWDWATLFCFAGLVTLLLQRSAEETPRDSLWQYAPPALGFATANYLGNHDQPIPASLLLIAALVYVFWVLKVRLPWIDR